jgi:hypothetical protein
MKIRAFRDVAPCSLVGVDHSAASKLAFHLPVFSNQTTGATSQKANSYDHKLPFACPMPRRACMGRVDIAACFTLRLFFFQTHRY